MKWKLPPRGTEYNQPLPYNCSKYALENKWEASVNTITPNTRNPTCAYPEAGFCF